MVKINDGKIHFINDTFHEYAVEMGWVSSMSAKRNRLTIEYKNPHHNIDVRKYKPGKYGWERDYK